MRILVATALYFIGLGFTSFAADEMVPDKTVASPRGTFRITQHYDGQWTSTISFAKRGLANIKLSEGHQWPGLFHVSPDDQWILHVQKSGSGDNISFLYRVERNGRLLRTEQAFGDLAFGYLTHSLRVPAAKLYHTGITFTAWNLKAGILRFNVHGSSVDEGGKGVSRELIYDLHEHTFRKPSE